MRKILLSILLIGLTFQSIAQVDTLEVLSSAMQKTIKAAIVKPSTYSSSQNQQFPTVYLLHGGSGSFSDWHRKVTQENLLIDLANQYQVLIITPGVGPSSYYYDSPTMDTVKYETYFIQELIPFIDQNYRTINKREARAITGLSMGGHGAMMLSAKNPELFIAAGSMSGVMNIDTDLWIHSPEFKQSRKEMQKAMLGDIQYKAPFSEYTAVGLVDRMKENGIALLIDCGVDDFLINTNRQIHQLLLENSTPHEYTERPGAHTWEYWTEALPFHMLFIDKVFKKHGTK
ncbi:alpha/beta hydrolase [Cecembia calidifontis]|uniref:S-formylglutathione hydrolase FrmB n=1 Tax=Cecembia calidifontis TaxID=1187080 RepID=A0A4Q7PE07_9BACT|nr:alpha/beta hydrolase family protein [Cecembia calidifontis]RZS98347.1 S-formylglutathione hydrolase FrmB [Cecembia calidifontis]